MSQTIDKAIAIFGCTGIGKTDLALKLAYKFKSEIINADSMQVYKHMDIGSAKVGQEERKLVKHYLIDFINPTENFDTYNFYKLALKKIKKLNKEKIIPLIVGGTGLYFKALFNGMFEGPGRDFDIRKNLRLRAKNEGLDALFDGLKNVDPIYAEKIHPNDERRIIRALEVYELTEKSLSEFHKKTKKPNINFLKIGLKMEREKLYERINQRCEKMLSNGFVDEVKKLINMNINENHTSMQGIGYSHIYKYLNNEYDYEEMMRLFKRDTRRFAKRQIILFKKEENVHWFSPNEEQNIISLIEKYIE